MGSDPMPLFPAMHMDLDTNLLHEDFWDALQKYINQDKIYLHKKSALRNT